MKTKIISPKKQGVEIKQVFTPDGVSIEGPGQANIFTRQQVEAWLAGMNQANRASGEEAVRKAVGETVRAKGSLRRSSEAPLQAVVTIFILLCVLCASMAKSHASEIIRGYSPADGQLLYAADLDNLVDESVIGVQFYNDQQTTPVLGSGYYFLVLNPSTETYYRMNAQQVLYGNTNLFLNVPPDAVPGYGTILFYDPTNNWIGSTTISNFLWNSASNINVAGLSFANTNNGGATNKFVLPRWPNPISGLPPNGTNYPLHILVFDTNGVPYRLGLSNAENAMAFDLGTNFSLPYEYVQEFYPWRFYGTNMASPYTNAFGWATNFPITAYIQTNIVGTNLPTLTDMDTIPVNAYQEGVVGVGPTNTSATLYSIYEYLTNKNALPPYTIARAQFSGDLPLNVSASEDGQGYGWGVTNMSASSGIITNCPFATLWTNPQPVSFISGPLASYSPNLVSNTLYWAQETNMPTLSFQIFTNYDNALLRTNPVLGANGFIGINGTGYYATLLWLTNYTTVNCSVIAECSGLNIETGYYLMDFSSPSATPFYYLTGVARGGNTSTLVMPSIALDSQFAPSANGVSVVTAVPQNTPAQLPLVELLVQPQ